MRSPSAARVAGGGIGTRAVRVGVAVLASLWIVAFAARPAIASCSSPSGPCSAVVDVADARFDNHPVPFSAVGGSDATADTSIGVQRHWFFIITNHGPGTVGSASINADSLRTFSTTPPPPFTAGPTMLAPNTGLRTSSALESAFALDNATPGFSSSRVVSPLVIPPGGATQTLTAKFTVDDASQGYNGMELLLDANLSGASWTFTSSSDPAATQVFEPGPGQQIGVSVSQPIVGTTYTVTFTGMIENTSTQTFAYKPRLLFQAGHDASQAAAFANSYAASDPVLEGTPTYSFDDAYELHPATSNAFGVDYQGGTAASPAVTTGAATGVSATSATLNGTVNPSLSLSNYRFEYGPTTAYGSSTPTASAGAGMADVPVSATITGLTSTTLIHYRLVATSAGGTSTGADMTFTTTPVGPPVEGVVADARPVSGDVFVALPLAAKVRAKVAGFGPLVKLTDAMQIPVGALVDTKHGIVALTTATNTPGGTQSGQFSKGAFIVQQSHTSPLTTAVMSGGNLNACSELPHGGAPKLVAAARSRSLFSNVHGRFRTRGRNSTATVRGTEFLVKDTCAGTTTTVKRGVVSVRDFTLRKTVKVKVHHKYLARAPKPGRHRR